MIYFTWAKNVQGNQLNHMLKKNQKINKIKTVKQSTKTVLTEEGGQDLWSLWQQQKCSQENKKQNLVTAKSITYYNMINKQTGIWQKTSVFLDDVTSICLHTLLQSPAIAIARDCYILVVLFIIFFFRPPNFRRPWADFHENLPHDTVCPEIVYLL